MKSTSRQVDRAKCMLSITELITQNRHHTLTYSPIALSTYIQIS